MTRTINVLAEDIEKGKRANCEECPIALAITRALPPITDVFGAWGTDGSEATLLLKVGGEYDVHLTLLLPAACGEFVRRFDAGLFVAPFSFDVELPDDAANYLKLN